jgi:nitrate reductase assembly molybdenum cofactor insertion protein NarJ
MTRPPSIEMFAVPGTASGVGAAVPSEEVSTTLPSKRHESRLLFERLRERRMRFEAIVDLLRCMRSETSSSD